MSTHLFDRLIRAATQTRLAAGGALVALALITAACSSGTPEKEAPAPAEAVVASGPLSVEWTDADLEKTGERIGYGSKPAAILSRDAQGALVFTPQTERDHLATRFTSLPTYEGERTLELMLDVKTPGGEACAANLQDQAYNLIATAPCKGAGEQKITAKVAPGVTGVRVYFQSPKREPLTLPARMRLTEQH